MECIDVPRGGAYSRLTNRRAHLTIETMSRCSACGEAVENAKNRRNLCNAASKHALPVLREGEYLCRCCFRDIEKVIKMRKDVDALMQQLQETAASATASTLASPD